MAVLCVSEHDLLIVTAIGKVVSIQTKEIRVVCVPPRASG